MSSSKSSSYIFLALFLGVIFGFLSIPFVNSFAKVISELFMNILKLLSLPIIFLSILSTITGMENLKTAKFFAKKILKYTLLTTLLAAGVALLLFVIIKPASMQFLSSDVKVVASAPSGTYLSFLLKIIPSNIIEPFAENNVIAIAFIALILSIAIIKLPSEQSDPLRKFFKSLFQAMLKISSAIIAILPIGVFVFTVEFFGAIKTSGSDLKKLLLYALCILLANAVQGLIILPLLLRRKKISPLKLAKGMMPAITMAFFSKSSNATLPISLNCARKRYPMSKELSSFSFPLCSVINMNGCAAFILITTLFVSISNGFVFHSFELISWIFIASIAAIGNAGVPMGCYFLTTAFLVGMNVPLTLMGLILPLYTFFDMVETALNVWSDACITAMVDQEIKEAPSTVDGALA